MIEFYYDQSVIDFQRAPKRKSPDPSDSDADIKDQPPLKDGKTNPPITSDAGVKGVIMSDDEEEVPRKPRRKYSSARSFEAMMDIDDGPLLKERLFIVLMVRRSSD